MRAHTHGVLVEVRGNGSELLRRCDLNKMYIMAYVDIFYLQALDARASQVRRMCINSCNDNCAILLGKWLMVIC